MLVYNNSDLEVHVLGISFDATETKEVEDKKALEILALSPVLVEVKVEKKEVKVKKSKK